MNYKEKLLNILKNNIADIQEKISKKIESIKVLDDKNLRQISKMAPEDQALHMAVKYELEKRKLELGNLHKAPYFAKSEVVKENGDEKIYYFAKHQFIEEGIYSWVAPIASIRFDDPGATTYKLPNGQVKNIKILEKEQYMIVDGKVVFFTVEHLGKSRELIYQENFTHKKGGFLLPEIVAQMEKAQDQVIRAYHKGSLIISGPAGSGKTTLALHRVAYLTQAPEISLLYPMDSIIVFVQDEGTREYFSHLLPELGIHNVKITTFAEWAFKILGLENYSYVVRCGSTEEEKDIYEYQKIKALRSAETPNFNKNHFTALSALYKKHFTQKDLKLFTQQKDETKLDRFDITILLMSYLKKNKKFEIRRSYLTPKNGVIKKKIEKNPVSYSLIVLDEFENYLPEQIVILKTCLQEETQSMVYVGDISQQVYLGTIKKWDDAGEKITDGRDIRLQKVYRNTKSILLFIKGLGYETEIPLGIREGPDVVEEITKNQNEEVAYIKKISQKYKEGTIGVIAKDIFYLEFFKKELGEFKNIHILTMNEAQGVEFDAVCIVGVDRDTFKVVSHEGVLPEHLSERRRMQKDLLYVALTRAITELHILSKEKLSEVLKD